MSFPNINITNITECLDLTGPLDQFLCFQRYINENDELKNYSVCTSGGIPFPITNEPECAPGFYCPNIEVNDTETWPQVCPPTQECQFSRLGDGWCEPQGKYEPQLCKPGHYCPNQTAMIECPEGTWCTRGTVFPRPCAPLSTCPAGTQIGRFYGGAVFALCFDVLFLFAYLWKRWHKEPWVARNMPAIRRKALLEAVQGQGQEQEAGKVAGASHPSSPSKRGWAGASAVAMNPLRQQESGTAPGAGGPGRVATRGMRPAGPRISISRGISSLRDSLSRTLHGVGVGLEGALWRAKLAFTVLPEGMELAWDDDGDDDGVDRGDGANMGNGSDGRGVVDFAFSPVKGKGKGGQSWRGRKSGSSGSGSGSSGGSGSGGGRFPRLRVRTKSMRRPSAAGPLVFASDGPPSDAGGEPSSAFSSGGHSDLPMPKPMGPVEYAGLQGEGNGRDGMGTARNMRVAHMMGGVASIAGPEVLPVVPVQDVEHVSGLGKVQGQTGVSEEDMAWENGTAGAGKSSVIDGSLSTIPPHPSSSSSSAFTATTPTPPVHRWTVREAATTILAHGFRQCNAGLRLELEFTGLGLTLPPPISKTILRGVSGRISPGRVTAIMGPSGAGKTTFLSVLMGRLQRTAGTLRINGQEQEINEYRRITGFVPQDDVMLRDLTVRENIEFAARVRLPRQGWSSPEISRLVDAVVQVLGLESCADTLAGRVSGGQRKRTNIGMELAVAPCALFLDEPTSGLDSTAALEVCSTLKAIADLGLTVVAVIHQPRAEIFASFDDLLLLAPGGHTVYMGPQAAVCSYFSASGCPVDEPGHRVCEGQVQAACGGGGGTGDEGGAGSSSRGNVYQQHASSSHPTLHLPTHLYGNPADELLDCIAGRRRVVVPTGQVAQAGLVALLAQHAVAGVGSSEMEGGASSVHPHGPTRPEPADPSSTPLLPPVVEVHGPDLPAYLIGRWKWTAGQQEGAGYSFTGSAWSGSAAASLPSYYSPPGWPAHASGASAGGMGGAGQAGGKKAQVTSLPELRAPLEAGGLYSVAGAIASVLLSIVSCVPSCMRCECGHTMARWGRARAGMVASMGRGKARAQARVARVYTAVRQARCCRLIPGAAPASVPSTLSDTSCSDTQMVHVPAPDVPVHASGSPPDVAALMSMRGAPLWKQFLLCHARCVVQQFRQANWLALELGVCVLAGAIMGLAGTAKDELYSGVLAPPYTPLSPAPMETLLPSIGLFVNMAVGVAGSPAAVRTFCEERDVYLREASGGHSLLAYFLAKDLAALYRLTLAALHFSGVFVLLARPTAGFETFYIMTLGIFYGVYGLSMLVSMVVSRENAPLLGVIAALSAACLCGYGPSLVQGRSWGLIYLQDALYSRWANELWMHAETFNYRHVFLVKEVSASIFGYELDRPGWDMAMMACIGVAMRGAAFLGLLIQVKFRAA